MQYQGRRKNKDREALEMQDQGGRKNKDTQAMESSIKEKEKIRILRQWKGSIKERGEGGIIIINRGLEGPIGMKRKDQEAYRQFKTWLYI